MQATVAVGAALKPDVGVRILQMMQQAGVAAIPRNYELFYSAYAGTDTELARKISGLGKDASQEALDTISEKHLAEKQGGTVMQRVQASLAVELEALLQLLQKEQNSLESYNRVLGETYDRISSKNATSVELIRSAAQILAEATGSTMAEGREIAHSVSERSTEMERVKSELDEYKRMANTDPLTRLANRRAFDEMLAHVFDDPDSPADCGLLIVDFDHFKRVNDTYGHPVGDRVLSIIGNVMRANLRSDVFIARTGGEEFAVIVQNVEVDTVERIAERLRAAIESTPLKNMKTGTNYGPITVSVGICMKSLSEGPSDLYRKCDLALYTAKASGRNRVQVYSDGLEGDTLGNRLLYRRGIA